MHMFLLPQTVLLLNSLIYINVFVFHIKLRTVNTSLIAISELFQNHMPFDFELKLPGCSAGIIKKHKKCIHCMFTPKQLLPWLSGDGNSGVDALHLMATK